MNLTSTYLEKQETKKPGALRFFLAQCLFFQSSNSVYKMIGLLAWANVGLVAYTVYAAFQKFAIHY